MLISTVKDRRFYSRLDTNIECIVYGNKNGIEMNGFIKDISEDGMMIHLNEDIDLNSSIKIIFCDEYSINSIIQTECFILNAKIVRKNKNILGCHINNNEFYKYVGYKKVEDYMKNRLFA